MILESPIKHKEGSAGGKGNSQFEFQGKNHAGKILH